jgi:putative ABC transport system permease protein
MILLQSLRMTARDWRSGELHFLLGALLIAVAALSSVSFFVDRMRTGLQQDAHQLLGGDIVVRSDQPLNEVWLQEAQQRGLKTAQTVIFPSMATTAGDESKRSQLISLKAVSEGYPLRGNVRIAPAPGAPDQAAQSIPAPGTAWVDADVLRGLGLNRGERLQLGDSVFTITGLISVEPDRGGGFMSFAPRAIIPLSDLPATNLVQGGSRVRYRLLVAGDADEAAAFGRWAQNEIEQRNLRGVSIESLESGQPAMQATLERAEQFLSLVGVLSALLAAVAVAMAARRFMLRHLDACAMLRCLGMTQQQVMLMYCLEFLMVGLLGSIAGVMVGYAAHFVLVEWLGALLATGLPPPSMLPALQGVATGLLLLVGFALPPVLQLRNVPHNRVIRREQSAPKPLTLATYLLGLATFAALLLWQAGDVKLGLLTAGGFFGGFALFALVGWLCITSLHWIRGLSSHPSWRFAVTALQRRPAASVVQVVALSLGLMALLLLTVVRQDLVDAWRQATPPDAPNRFVLNIQPYQKADFEAKLEQAGLPPPDMYPMIRGRLVKINDNVITEDTFGEGRARRMVDREFNLSTMHDIPEQNRVVQGSWFEGGKPEASVEQGLAETLGLELGDTLTFDIAGELVQAPVTSIRDLEWGSMRVNFFVVLNPELMQDMPQTWITAFRLPEEKGALVGQLMNEFPNLTIVDIGSIVKQIQDVVDQVVAAVEFLFLFTLASGVLVLYAALAGTRDERMREASLLRALGATRKQLSQAQWIEFALLGGLAGLLAASGAYAVGWILASQIFQFDWVFNPVLWIVGLVLGALCAFIGGWAGLRQVLTRPPLHTLREA